MCSVCPPAPPCLSPEAVRLVKGPNRCSGKLEVKSGQSWVPVCDSFFTSAAAVVACRDLGCGFFYRFYGRDHSPHFENAEAILNPVFNCKGKEKHLMACPSTPLNATEEELSQCSNTYLSCTGNNQGHSCCCCCSAALRFCVSLE